MILLFFSGYPGSLEMTRRALELAHKTGNTVVVERVRYQPQRAWRFKPI